MIIDSRHNKCIETMEKYKISATDGAVLSLMQQAKHRLAQSEGD